MFKKSFFFILLLNIILLTGCGTVSHMSLSKNNSATLKTIYVNPEIKRPELPHVFGSGPRIAMAFGAIGGLAEGLADAATAKDMQSFIDKNKIDVRTILYQQWIKQLATKSKFKLGDNKADAVLDTDIVSYGVSLPTGFATYFHPTLKINAYIRRNNKIIWQDSIIIFAHTPGLPAYLLKQIMSDPVALKTMWNKAAEKALNEMIVDMNR